MVSGSSSSPQVQWNRCWSTQCKAWILFLPYGMVVCTKASWCHQQRICCWPVWSVGRSCCQVPKDVTILSFFIFFHFLFLLLSDQLFHLSISIFWSRMLDSFDSSFPSSSDWDREDVRREKVEQLTWLTFSLQTSSISSSPCSFSFSSSFSPFILNMFKHCLVLQLLQLVLSYCS